MKTEDLKIVVSGDICIDLLLWRTYVNCTKDFRWKYYPNVHSISKAGEALLLSKLVALSTGVSIRSPQIQNFEKGLSNEILRSTSVLELFPVNSDEKDNNKVYRVKQFLGFSGPSSNIPKLLPVVNDDENADIVILDDEDNGFNINEEYWPLALKSNKKSPVVVYKLNNPTSTGKLWRQLEEFHIENTIIVINGDDLRSKGVNISKSLSWEKTALDFVWQMNNNPNLEFIANCHHFIVTFGLEGAIYYKNKGIAESRLYFLTNEFEGGFIKEYQGKMYGLTACFVAGLTRSISLGINNNEELSVSIC